MHLSGLQEAYDHEGPFASAYLEGSQPSENAETREGLRWRELAERLRSEGAQDACVRAIGDRLEDEQAGKLAAEGMAAVAARGEVVFAAPLRGPLGGDRAHWSPLPDLGPYVRANADTRRQLTAVVDSAGADLAVRDVWGYQLHHVEGQEHPLHKVREGAWSHKRIQNKIEEVADRNAAMVANAIAQRVAETKPSAVILAGEVEARERVHRKLANALSRTVVVTDRGGRLPDGGVDGELDDAVREIAAEAARRSRSQLLERLGSGLGTGAAVQGLGPVMEALRAGAVEVLLFGLTDPDTGSVPERLEAPVAVGRDPLHLAPTRDELRELLTGAGVGAHTEEPPIDAVPAESAIVRAGAACAADAEVIVPSRADVPDGVDLSEGVAALLRYPVPSGT